MSKQQILYHPLKVQEGQRIPFSTGSLRVDLSLATGGILSGDLVEISGPPASGKTVICHHIAASVQRCALPVVWIDSDHTFDPPFARRCGIALDLLHLAQAWDAEQALDIMVSLAGCAELGLIVLDSLDSLVPRSELRSGAFGALENADFEAETDELISQALAMVWQRTQLSLVSIIYTHGSRREMNASYHRLSARHARMAPGLRASVNLRLEPGEHIEVDGAVVGIHTSIQCARRPKTRSQKFPGAATLLGRGVSLNPPFQQRIDLDIMYNQGIVNAGEIFDLALGLGLIEYQEMRFIYADRNLGSNRSEAIGAIEGLDLSAGLEQMIRRKLLW